jgi:hypothetical protein
VTEKRKHSTSTRDRAGAPGEIELQEPLDRDAPIGRGVRDESPLESLKAPESETTPLLGSADASGFESRWQEIQVAFVDEPRESVERADTLVADLMQQLTDGFAEERKRLEAQWDRGDEASTEDLRLALMRYRSFFNRLLSA